MNIMTIDVEDWYQSQDFNLDRSKWGDFEPRVEYSTKVLLDILDKYNTRATFFILGYIALNNPQLVKEIASRGHEIGSHGMWHKMVSRQTRDEFRHELLYSKKSLEDITGQQIKMFRAPTWSISLDTLWALETLEEEGFICDSSIQPFATPLSGVRGAPVDPYHPIVNNRRLKLLEFPPTVLKSPIGVIPFSGGLYLRTLPYKAVDWALRKVNQKRPGMVYVHPWELDVEQPKLKVPFLIRQAHYFNIKTTKDKVEKLLESYSFTCLGEFVHCRQYPCINIQKNFTHEKPESAYAKV